MHALAAAYSNITDRKLKKGVDTIFKEGEVGDYWLKFYAIYGNDDVGK